MHLKKTTETEYGTISYYSIIEVKKINDEIRLFEVESVLNDYFAKNKLKSIKNFCKQQNRNILVKNDDGIYGELEAINQTFLPFENQNKIKNILLKFYEDNISY